MAAAERSASATASPQDPLQVLQVLQAWMAWCGVDCSGGDGYAAQDGYHRGADACYSCRNGDNAGDVGDDAADVLDFAEEFVPGEQARDVNVSERVA
jgi:hypothetical protein